MGIALHIVSIVAASLMFLSSYLKSREDPKNKTHRNEVILFGFLSLVATVLLIASLV